MRSLEQLLGGLAKVVDDTYRGIALDGICQGINVHSTLVCEVMKHIKCLHSFLALLLVAEDQVNPLVKVSADVIALQGFAVQANKLMRITLGPWW